MRAPIDYPPAVAIWKRSSSRQVSRRSFESVTFEREKRKMKTLHTLLLAAGLVTGLAFESSEAFAAGPMIAPGALATPSIVEKTVVVVHKRAVVRRPVVVHRRVVR